MEQQQPYAQPQFVMMQVPQRNSLGVFGFFLALIGLFIPTGIVALLGLVLSLAAIGRAPRGFATFGVIIGLVGTVIWLTIMGGVVVLGAMAAIGMAVGGAVAFALIQPEALEVTSDMFNAAFAVQEYEREHAELPSDLAILPLGVAKTTDPWGGTYKLVPDDDEPGYDIVSGGPDGVFDTDDDVRLSALDRYWEAAFEDFDVKMADFGRRLDEHGGCQIQFSDSGDFYISTPDYATFYENAARRAQAAKDAPCDTGSIEVDTVTAPEPPSAPTPPKASSPPEARAVPAALPGWGIPASDD